MSRRGAVTSLTAIAAFGLLFGCAGDGGGGDPSDTTPPSFGLIAATPDPAAAGQTLTISFAASEALSGSPAVTVGGNVASFVSVDGLDYTYVYVVQGTEPEGAASIAISGCDLVGNPGSGAGSVVLDFTAPTVTVDALLTDDTTPALTGAVGDAGATIVVTVDGQTNPATNNGDGTWILADDTLSELAVGTYDVQVTATDAAGNAALDSTADELTITSGGDTTPPAFGPIAASPDPAGWGADLAITFTASETLIANPTVTVAGNTAGLVSVLGLDYTYSYTVTGAEPEGSVTIAVSGSDLAGNPGAGSGSVTFDFTAPTVGAVAQQWTCLGAPFSVDLAAYVSDNHDAPGELAFAVVSGGGSFTGSVYSNTWNVAGLQSVQFSVTDRAGNAASGTLDVDVMATASATMWMWGAGGYGQLDNGSTDSQDTPVQVQGLFCVQVIGLGSTWSFACECDGTVWGWGSNVYGKLGDGTTESTSVPVRALGLSNILDVDGGIWHSIALRDDGSVWACGRNAEGQLGDGTETDRGSFEPVSGASGIVDVAAGGCHGVAVKGDGTVVAWGRNYYGQLGDDTTNQSTTPVQVLNMTDVVAVDAGNESTVAMKTDGTVWTWGRNFYGQLGDGTYSHRHTPVQVSGLSEVCAIAAGQNHVIALKNDGSVWAWGRNYHYQLGDGTTTDRNVPVQVLGLDNVMEIAAGGERCGALKADGSIWHWGQKGMDDVEAPTFVATVVGAKSLVSGGGQMAVIK